MRLIRPLMRSEATRIGYKLKPLIYFKNKLLSEYWWWKSCQLVLLHTCRPSEKFLSDQTSDQMQNSWISPRNYDCDDYIYTRWMTTLFFFNLEFELLVFNSSSRCATQTSFVFPKFELRKKHEEENRGDLNFENSRVRADQDIFSG